MSQDALKSAHNTLAAEVEGLQQLSQSLGDDFVAAIDLLANAKGRVIISGMGKSGHIGNKITATMASTGTPAHFVHPAEASHGDLGMITPDDVVLGLSWSGGTQELASLLNYTTRFSIPLIAITSNKNSFLGQQANYILNAYVEKEACPNNLAPTSSTTAQLVMGDALAMALLNLRGFSSSDFAKFHPGGSLGKQLYLRVSTLTQENKKPQVSPKANIKDVIMEISKNMLGVTAVIEGSDIVGIITDGDLRRMMSNNDSFAGLTANDIMSKNPKTIDNNAMAVAAMELMESHGITQVIAQENGVYCGIVHIHDLTKEGII